MCSETTERRQKTVIEKKSVAIPERENATSVGKRQHEMRMQLQMGHRTIIRRSGNEAVLWPEICITRSAQQQCIVIATHTAVKPKRGQHGKKKN